MGEVTPDRSGHLEIDGQRIWWEYHGTGQRDAVVLLNGLAMHTSDHADTRQSIAMLYVQP